MEKGKQLKDNQRTKETRVRNCVQILSEYEKNEIKSAACSMPVTEKEVNPRMNEMCLQ